MKESEEKKSAGREPYPRKFVLPPEEGLSPPGPSTGSLGLRKGSEPRSFGCRDWNEAVTIPVQSPEEEFKVELPKLRKVRRTLSGRTETQKLIDVLGFVNSVIKNDTRFSHKFPISDEARLMEAVKDGVLLGTLINNVIPGAVDPKSLILPEHPTQYQKIENLRAAINAGVKIGCANDVLSPGMVVHGKSVLVINMIDDLRKLKTCQVLRKSPSLMALATNKETLEDVFGLPTEELLKRWLNYHLEKSGAKGVRVNDLGKDLEDGRVYLQVMGQLDPCRCPSKFLEETDPSKRMRHVLDCAVNIGVRHSLNVEGLMSDPQRTHTLLCCLLFNAKNGLEPPAAKSEAPKKTISSELLPSLGI